MSSQWPGLPADAGLDLLGQEILAEKAAALSRAGQKAEAALARLRAAAEGSEQWRGSVKEAADCVYAYFIQRELCGFRKHDDVIREYRIPKEVLIRLGAR